MTDKAYAVPLHEQLASVPRDARLIIDDADGMGTRFIPVGRMCHEAAEALQLAQPEPAECDGGQCGIGGYCKDCPKTKPELKIINMENFVGSGKPLVPVCWMNVDDIDKTDWKVWAHGKPTISMPLFASPPQREWQGLTDMEIEQIVDAHWNDPSMFVEAIEATLKAKNALPSP